jgi:carboxymethylenebutenolidase
VLVVSEIFGVHEHIADITRRLAKQGYFAVAPELFVRQGDAKAISDIPTLLGTIISKVPDAQVMGDLDATLAWAKGNGGDTAKLGITGFCWGGRQTWLFNAHSPAVKAAVAWYGPLVGTANALQPKYPVELTAQLHGPTLGLYGGADTGLTAEHVRKMKDALAAGDAAAQKSEIIVYPDTPHAFNADYRPSYRKGPARTAGNGRWPGSRPMAWPEARRFFRRSKAAPRAAFFVNPA